MKHIHFFKPKHGKAPRILQDAAPPIRRDEGLSAAETEERLHRLQEVAPDACIFTAFKTFCMDRAETTDTADECNVTVPRSLYSIYREDLKYANDAELKEAVAAEFQHISVTESDAEAIALATVLQRSCLEWFEQRCGRITASIFIRF